MIEFRLQKKLDTAEGIMSLNVSASINTGDLVCLYGESGAGKTSILRMIAGFMNPGEGFVKAGRETWFDSSAKVNVPPQKRSAGFVFQDYALFPNMNVRENIAFGLSKNESGEIVDELMQLTGLTGLSSRSIQSLSGGQQQRVALSRAIAKKPPLLLLDEPLSALDRVKRGELQSTLLDLHKRFALTTILVSHDTDEIMKLADTVIHLEQGRFTAQVTPSAFFTSDHDEKVLRGTVISISKDGTATVLIQDRVLQIPIQDESIKAQTQVEILSEGHSLVIRRSF